MEVYGVREKEKLILSPFPGLRLIKMLSVLHLGSIHRCHHLWTEYRQTFCQWAVAVLGGCQEIL